MSKTLTAQNLTVTYFPGGRPILDGVALEVRHSELVGVVGPNGCGKSTLVRALSRTLRPAGGSALLDGRDVYSLTAREAASAIGVVPQTTTVAFDFTVRDLVDMGRTPRLPSRPFASLTPDDARIVTTALKATGTEHLADRIANTLSGGELQRVMIARALAQEPDVLLLDEPTAHLDLQHQLGILELVRRLAHNEGKAVLTVLHDLNLAAAFCDRLILMKSGRVVADGKPAEVLTAENVMNVYGTRVWMRSHPTSGRPYLVALPNWEQPIAGPLGQGGPKVHVICGGGTGTGALMLLQHLGCPVTAGPLNAGDSDQEAAEALGIEYAREAPFTAVSDAVLRHAESLAAAADIVLVTDVPFGRGNVGALEMALRLRRAGETVWLLEPDDADISRRDFTGGWAVTLWNGLLSDGAAHIAGLDGLDERVNAWKETAVADRSARAGAA